MRKPLGAAIIGVALWCSPAMAGPYLNELLEIPAYRAAWTHMLAGRVVPAWLKSYARTSNGPTTPSEDVTIGDETYVRSNVCKTGDCGSNEFYVLFDREGARAYGLLATENGDTTAQRYFGSPSPALRAALVQAAGE